MSGYLSSCGKVVEIDELRKLAKQLELPSISIPKKSMELFMGNNHLNRLIYHNKKIKGIISQDAIPENYHCLTGMEKVIGEEAKDRKIVMLDPNKVPLNSKNAESNIPFALLEFMKFHRDTYFQDFLINITYDLLTADEVFAMIVPGNVQLGGVQFVGHIAYLNLAQENLPYKHIIGQVLLEKHRNIRTVVNKTEPIHEQYRITPIEILAGEDCLTTVAVENNIKFHVNLESVYWNSRLSTERDSIAKLIGKNKFVVDLFGGVGSFACYLGKNKCRIISNDANPVAAGLAELNRKSNKISENNFYITTLDARDLLRQLFVRDEIWIDRDENSSISRPKIQLGETLYVIGNLPGSAISFLDAIQDAYDSWSSQSLIARPVIFYLYFFHNSIDPMEYAFGCIQSALQSNSFILESVNMVRDVSPTRIMYRACIKLFVKSMSQSNG